jgi:hypothetical protein
VDHQWPGRPGQQPAEEVERQIRLNIRNQCLLARSYAQAGFVPILDFPFVSRKDRLDRYRRALRRLDFYLVVLDPGRDVALQRDLARPGKTVAQLWVHMEDALLRSWPASGCG